jgi:two-component system, NarL family, response regulator DevR
MDNSNKNNGLSSDEVHRKSKVLVVDEQPTMRLGMRLAIESDERFMVVGEAESAEEASTLVENLHPDVIVIDLALRGKSNGIEVLKDLKSWSNTHVVVHTSRNSEEDVFLSCLAGADSFVYKGEKTTRLVEAVRETCMGKRVWFLGEERRNPGLTVNSTSDELRLTRREKEVFSLLVSRHTNTEIAQRLYISVQTAKNYVSNIYKKLDAKERAGLSRRATSSKRFRKD